MCGWRRARARREMARRIASLLILAAGLTLTACASLNLPFVGRELPGLPKDLGQLPEVWSELGLPQLSELADVPGLDALPLFTDPPGGMVYQGPTARTIQAGERVAGTDTELVRAGDKSAEFRIGNLSGQKALGDSVDYDGAWPGLSGVDYHSRLRIYHIGEGNVGAAGVHRLLIDAVDPRMGPETATGVPMKFPFLASVGTGEVVRGMTYRYVGSEERGAQFEGLADGEYPYRKLGDSLHWAGTLRNDIGVEYDVRVLYYDAGSVRLGGVATIYLPDNAPDH